MVIFLFILVQSLQGIARSLVVPRMVVTEDDHSQVRLVRGSSMKNRPSVRRPIPTGVAFTTPFADDETSAKEAIRKGLAWSDSYSEVPLFEVYDDELSALVREVLSEN